ncbi:PadR family transcriptional regulator [Frondihabitans sucicola]|uniref:PadR family transcriptional regulator n=1 Tax=Frondihabitans sucicola TaxID=1268041 RepID=A0ABN6XW88_9MICO|nr:PadR family transcriptional regulator [Frondihabitans sucicola]BDZ49249.1 PadR family transcriptional regulator [Frondihabitans sucicola]
MSFEMREPTFVILSSLAEGPRHGYGIITDTAGLTGGTMRLQAGTLYAALDRLRVDGLVEVSSEEIVHGRLRRSFTLTTLGRSRLAEEARRRQHGAELALRRLRTKVVGA